jgi:hypothetical protein
MNSVYIVKNSKDGKKLKDAITRKVITFTSKEAAQEAADAQYRYEFLNKGRAGKRVVVEVAA